MITLAGHFLSLAYVTNIIDNSSTCFLLCQNILFVKGGHNFEVQAFTFVNTFSIEVKAVFGEVTTKTWLPIGHHCYTMLKAGFSKNF